MYYFSTYKTKSMRRLFLFLIIITSVMQAQEPIPFHEISEAPQEITPSTVLLRMTQGLGYRFYWASKDLTPNDLEYRPSPEASSSLETLQHIYGLSDMIKNATLAQHSQRPLKNIPEDYTALRRATLENLAAAAAVFSKDASQPLEQMSIVIDRGEKSYTFPLWNLINGPLSDAIYHTGQLVSFRRTTGNPIDSGVNVFMGKTKEKK